MQPVEIDHWLTVQKMLRGYRAAQVLITCAQLGLFQHLADGPQTASNLAGQTGADPGALQRLLEAAVGLGLLSKQGESYANTSLATTCLAKEGPYYLGHLVRRESAFYQRWGYLAEAVRTGRRPEANVRDEGQTNWVLDFELALFDLARFYGPLVAEALALPIDRHLTVLDVGGGHGGYSMALARRYPNLQAVVFELPAAAEAAVQIIDGEGMSDRVSVQVGDFQKQNLGSGFDLVLLFGVLVSETLAGRIDLLRKAYAALIPGGQVAIREFCLEADQMASVDTALFSLNMLLSSEAGDIMRWTDLQSWLLQAGFEQPRQIRLPIGVSSSLIVTTKPA